MTGFGRGESVADGVVWRAEISSVNRKALELIVQLPRELGELEAPLRNRLAEKLSRGRVQCGVTADRGAATAASLRVDETLAEQYAAHLRRLGFSPENSDPTRWPGVFTLEQVECPVEIARPHVDRAVDAALAQLLVMRRTEGAHLRTDIGDRLQVLAELLEQALRRSPGVVARHRDALRQRLAEAGLPLPLEDERLLKEIALFADRCDISEEVTRARSHLLQFHGYLESPEPVGRALDFLCQELFREWNTVGSKANDAELAQIVVRAKAEIERIREQVQNVE